MESLTELMTRAMAIRSTGRGYDAEAILSSTPLERAVRAADAYNRSAGDLDTTDGYNCSACLNRGYFDVVDVHEDGQFHEYFKPCRCIDVRKSLYRLKRSGLENVIRDYTFDKFTASEPWQAEIKASALRFCDDESPAWFYIGGAIGCGKTHLCTAIAGRMLRKKPLQYVLWVDESANLKATVNDDETYEKRMRWLKSVDVLYIDDFFKVLRDRDGSEMRPTAADIRLAYEIINSRYAAKLKTIISSERTVSEICEIDEAIGSRIVERTRGYCMNVGRDKAKNYRMRAG